MTIPVERTRSIGKARDFLRSLLDPKKTPKVPKWVRREAYWALRHFPSDYDIERAKTQYEEVFGDLDEKTY